MVLNAGSFGPNRGYFGGRGKPLNGAGKRTHLHPRLKTPSQNPEAGLPVAGKTYPFLGFLIHGFCMQVLKKVGFFFGYR